MRHAHRAALSANLVHVSLPQDRQTIGRPQQPSFHYFYTNRKAISRQQGRHQGDCRNRKEESGARRPKKIDHEHKQAGDPQEKNEGGRETGGSKKQKAKKQVTAEGADICAETKYLLREQTWDGWVGYHLCLLWRIPPAPQQNLMEQW